MSNKTEHNKKALLEALKKSLGVVTTACKECGVGRTSYYEYYNHDKEFKDKVDDLCDEALDFVESKLFSRIDGYEHKEDKVFNNNGTPLIVPIIKHYPPDPASMIFYLKTKGQKRGYIERHQIAIEKLPTIKIVDGTNDNSDPNLQGKQPKHKKDKPQ